MAGAVILQPQPRAWLEHSVLQPYAAGYGEHLDRGRYSRSTKRVYFCCVAHFAHWLTGERYAVSAIDEAAVARFISEHLPGCDCPYPVRRLAYEIKAALARLLEALRADGIISSRSAAGDHLGKELARFDAHMLEVGGLALNTRRQRCRIVGQFLREQFHARPIIISAVGPAAVQRFVLGDGKEWSAGTIGVIGGATGGAFRRRDRRTASVVRSAIPVMQTSLRDGALPHRSRAEVQRSRQASPRRIDWHAGTIRLAGTKMRRADILPLPAATGSAIAAYLRDERPSTLNRAVFVRHVAPY